MPVNYKVVVYDLSGNKAAELNDFNWVTLKKTVNNPGLLTLGLRGNHPLLADIADKYEVLLYRKPPAFEIGGLTIQPDWALELATLYRDVDWSFEKGKKSAILYCQGINSILSWRRIAYYAGQAGKSQFTNIPAETILKDLVYYNLGAGATTGNNRILSNVITYPTITIETDATGGNNLYIGCTTKNLLSILQEVASIGGGDFDLVRTGAGAYQFRFYAGQLGTDRSSTVTFALGLQNMDRPFYRVRRAKEFTVALVGGQGEANLRTFVTRQGANYNATYNNIEGFIAATDVKQDANEASNLSARGDAALAQNQAFEEFGFDVIQAPSSYYGVHYFLGDIVTIVNPFNGASYTQKISSINLSWAAGKAEQVGVEVS